jgi:glycosyltransferase involved in cell wall biosynthesis
VGGRPEVSPPLRILVLNLRDVTNPKAGGAEKHLHELFRRLGARGHQVTLHCGGYPKARPVETIENVRIVRRGNRFTTAAWSVVFYLRFRKRFDVVVDYTCQLHFLTPLYARLPRVAMAMHIVGDVYRHDLLFPIGHLLAAWEALSLRLFYGQERFIAISQSTADELIHHGVAPERVRILHCGRHEPAPPVAAAKTEYPSLLYYGRLRRYKRVDLLLKALPTIRAAVPGTRLHIVGAGDRLVSLQRLAKQLRLDGAVVFHGWLPDGTRWQVVGSTWVSMQPSLKEGWGLTVLEAAQCGVPSVASRVPGLQDAIIPGHTGELFQRDDPADLVSRTVRLLTDGERRRRLGQQAAVWANSFSWDQASLELEDMLRNWVSPQAEVLSRDRAHARS